MDEYQHLRESADRETRAQHLRRLPDGTLVDDAAIASVLGRRYRHSDGCDGTCTTQHPCPGMQRDRDR